MANNSHSISYTYAKKYYPVYWNDKMLKALVEAGKMYDWEYEEITGNPYQP